MAKSDWRIGESYPIEDDRAVCRTGPHGGHPRWHALTVIPQSESAVQAWLKLRGVYAFHPVRWRTRIVRGKPVERQQRYLPGYVFARFPGRVVPHKVLAFPHISDAIRMQSGSWGIIHPRDIRKLHAMRDVDSAQEEAHRKAARIKVGDRVRILEGLWAEGQEVEVREIVAGKARFHLRMFGAEVPGEADVARVRKIV